MAHPGALRCASRLNGLNPFRRTATSKRNRARRAVTSAVAPPVAAEYPLPEPDLLRRLLLLFLTIVLVARPLVWGEDAGLVSDFSDTSGLALILLTILALAAWAGWRLAMRRPAVYLGPVDYALLAMSLLLAVGVGGLGSRRAAMLAGWEWFALGLLLVLVRQLAVRPEDKQGILCVLLASIVGLSAQGTYQAIRDIPVEVQEARKAKDVASWVKHEAAQRGVNPSDYEVMQLADRLENRQVHGPYFHPASMAGILVLGVPIILAALLASVRAGGNPWQTIALAGCVLIAGAMLWMTGVRVALCALGAVAAGALCLVWPGRMRFGVRATLSAILTVGGFAALALTGAMETPLARAREVWPATWQLFEHHFWLGVGPGQFSFFYPRYMAETAGPRVAEPGNFLLEIGTTGGVFALVMLGLGIALFVRALLRWRTADLVAALEPAPPPASAAPAEQPVRWEFYLGGMVGLVMSFVFRAGTLPGDSNSILQEALRVGIHAVVWFAAFALFEGIAWTEGEYIGGLCAGVVALLLTLFFVNGIGFPSVAAYLWVAVGLVLAVVAPRPAPWLSRQPLLVQLPVPVFLATAFGFFAFVGYPPTASATALRKSQYAGVEFITDVTGKKGQRTIKDMPDFIRKRIIEPLEVAQKDDPNNVRLMTELAGWYGQLWSLNRFDEQGQDAGKVAIAWAKLAQEANPEAGEGYRAEFDVRVRVAVERAKDIELLEKQIKDPKHPVADRMRARQLVDRLQEQRRKQFRLAGEAIGAYLSRDPTDPELQMRLASVFYESKNPLAPAVAREARRLDGLVKPPRGLTDPQRTQLEKWLGKESGK